MKRFSLLVCFFASVLRAEIEVIEVFEKPIDVGCVVAFVRDELSTLKEADVPRFRFVEKWADVKVNGMPYVARGAIDIQLGEVIVNMTEFDALVEQAMTTNAMRTEFEKAGLKDRAGIKRVMLESALVGEMVKCTFRKRLKDEMGPRPMLYEAHEKPGPKVNPKHLPNPSPEREEAFDMYTSVESMLHSQIDGLALGMRNRCLSSYMVNLKDPPKDAGDELYLKHYEDKELRVKLIARLSDMKIAIAAAKDFRRQYREQIKAREAGRKDQR